MKSILFICTGNTCRSPLAEGLFQKMISSENDYSVASAGLHALRGLPASEKTVLILANQGIDFSSFRSQPLVPERVEQATHIFVMTKAHLHEITTLYPHAREKTFLLHEGTTQEDVPDPHGGTVETYQQCAQSIQRALENIFTLIKKNII